MDECRQELGELRDYGYKLLEELRYPNIISMLQQTITHISGIAEEYSNEADKWHEKYDECYVQNKKIQGQIDDLTAVVERQNQELRAVIDAQAQKIVGMGSDFAKQMESLRSYRDEEIDGYKEKVQALIDTQKQLDSLRNEVAKKEKELQVKIDEYKKEKETCEKEHNLLEQQKKDNQNKIDDYDKLFESKMKLREDLENALKVVADKDKEASEVIKYLTDKYKNELAKREALEKELTALKNQSSGDVASDDENNIQGQGDSQVLDETRDFSSDFGTR